MERHLRSWLTGGLLGAAALGCNAILGIHDLPPDPSAEPFTDWPPCAQVPSACIGDVAFEVGGAAGRVGCTCTEGVGADGGPVPALYIFAICSGGTYSYCDCNKPPGFTVAGGNFNCADGGGGEGGADGGGGEGGEGGGGGTFNCDFKVAGFEYCYTYNDLSSTELNALKSGVCTSKGDTTPSSCPGSPSGSCENIPLMDGGSITYGYAIYGATSSEFASFKSACLSEKGTWSNK